MIFYMIVIVTDFKVYTQPSRWLTWLFDIGFCNQMIFYMIVIATDLLDSLILDLQSNDLLYDCNSHWLWGRHLTKPLTQYPIPHSPLRSDFCPHRARKLTFTPPSPINDYIICARTIILLYLTLSYFIDELRLGENFIPPWCQITPFTKNLLPEAQL